MKYFNTLPLITQKDFNNNDITINNIITRAYFLPSLLRNVLAFYEYDVQDTDTPEIISYKYYNDTYRYWMVLYANNFVDPQDSWPLTDQQFINHLNNAYKNNANNISGLEYSQITNHHYEQIISISNDFDEETQKITTQIDQDTYNTLVEGSVTNSYYGDANTLIHVTKTIEKRSVSIYIYEQELNESKRRIYLLDVDYVPGTENQFVKLMSK